MAPGVGAWQPCGEERVQRGEQRLRVLNTIEGRKKGGVQASMHSLEGAQVAEVQYIQDGSVQTVLGRFGG